VPWAVSRAHFVVETGVRIVRAVDDAETVTPGNWAPAGRPVRPLAGVEVKVMTVDRAARADRRTRWNAMKPWIQCVLTQ
jgi:hypothetical protein